MSRGEPVILDGRAVSEQSKTNTAEKCGRFLSRFGRKPCLAVVLVGNNPASLTYVSSKKKACDLVGIDHKDINLEESTTQDQLLAIIKELNADQTVDGILVQLPLPPQIDENTVILAVDPNKDVDGFNPVNSGKLLQGQECLVPCTPKGILKILDAYSIDTQGKDVCIIGRSNIVGKPMAALMLAKDRNATVTVCNSKTKDLAFHTQNADIVVAAIGKPLAVKANMIKDGAVVIDVGINRVPDSSKKSGFALKGDVDFEQVSLKASAITPVPGGVGPMTIAMLMENTLTAACWIKGTMVEDL